MKRTQLKRFIILGLVIAALYAVIWFVDNVILPPTGERIAFEFANRICVMTATGKRTRCLASGIYPAWSPDGQRIAFETWSDYSICVMSLEETETTCFTGERGFGQYPTWSPDGQRIAFVTPYQEEGWGLYTMNADGTDITHLIGCGGGGNTPDWSPDGEQIAFVSNHDGEATIYVVNIDGSALTPLTPTTVNSMDPEWSPDGRQIAFSSDRSGNWEIYVMDADGSNLVQLTDDPEVDWSPTWSPDGQRIAFLSARDGRQFFNPADSNIYSAFAIYVMNADGSDPVRISRRIDAFRDIDWSP